MPARRRAMTVVCPRSSIADTSDADVYVYGSGFRFSGKISCDGDGSQKICTQARNHRLDCADVLGGCSFPEDEKPLQGDMRNYAVTTICGSATISKDGDKSKDVVFTSYGFMYPDGIVCDKTKQPCSAMDGDYLTIRRVGECQNR